MSDIPLLKSLTSIPKDQFCQEASSLSGNRYFACGAPAVAIIDNGDSRPYAMCLPCAMHNLKRRNASLIYTTDAGLQEQAKRGEVKVARNADPRNAPSLGRQHSDPNEKIPPTGAATQDEGGKE